MAAATARTVDEHEQAMGRSVRELRLRADLTQAELARRANVGLSALRSLERGAGSSLATLIPVVRALGRDDWLDALAPPVAVSPLARLAEIRAQQTGRRERASGRSGLDR